MHTNKNHIFIILAILVASLLGCSNIGDRNADHSRIVSEAVAGSEDQGAGDTDEDASFPATEPSGQQPESGGNGNEILSKLLEMDAGASTSSGSLEKCIVPAKDGAGFYYVLKEGELYNFYFAGFDKPDDSELVYSTATMVNAIESCTCGGFVVGFAEESPHPGFYLTSYYHLDTDKDEVISLVDHTKWKNDSANNVTYSEGKLYYRDMDSLLYRVDCHSLQTEELGYANRYFIFCDRIFYSSDNALYYYDQETKESSAVLTINDAISDIHVSNKFMLLNYSNTDFLSTTNMSINMYQYDLEEKTLERIESQSFSGITLQDSNLWGLIVTDVKESVGSVILTQELVCMNLLDRSILGAYPRIAHKSYLVRDHTLFYISYNEATGEYSLATELIAQG